MSRSKAWRPARNTAPPTGLPAALRSTLASLLGEELDALERSLEGPSPVSIRVNPYKPFRPVAERVPWCASGYYLPERPAFTFDPLLHAGAYYVQEASSMLLEPVLKATGMLPHDLVALDLCAAPGGKTTHLRGLLTPGSLLVANEVDRRRATILQENLWKWGLPNTVVSNSDPADLVHLEGLFDLIVLDAPCSGEGMFRKDPFARAQWSMDLVHQCATTQRGILEHAWNALAPGGTLVYSTCTWEPSENEEQLAALVALGTTAIDPAFDPAWGAVRLEANGIIGHRCYPHRVNGEGFFVAAVRKPGTWSAQVLGNTIHTPALPGVRSHMPQLTMLHQDVTCTIDACWSGTVQRLLNALHILSPGTPVSYVKGDKQRPHPALATSLLLDRTAFAEVEVNEQQAIAYLRGEALAAKEASGEALVVHAGFPLGWVHGAGNRWNNGWPDAWRIRTQQPRSGRVSWSGIAPRTGTW
ncbi:MAG: methyltransferase RsmF C-terminal domain-like protein [Flavobacteriales bacterium]